MSELVKYSEQTFESIKHVNEYGEEYWLARELQLVLEYAQWRRFSDAIERAKLACKNSGFAVEDHFADVGKMVDIGSGAERQIDDVISEEFHRQHSNSVLQAGDVVVVQSGHVGDCTVVTEEIAGSNSHAIIIMTPTPRINSHYCSCYINSPMGQGKLVGCITGNTVKHILASDMKNYLLPCPEKDEQDELATLFCAVEKEITAIEKEIEAWRQQKKALMQFLLTGLVRVNA